MTTKDHKGAPTTATQPREGGVDAPGVAPPPCRRCTECEGEAHHWIEEAREEDGFVGFICKHCPHECESEECEACGDEIPRDIAHLCTDDATWLCPACTENMKADAAAEGA